MSEAVKASVEAGETMGYVTVIIEDGREVFIKYIIMEIVENR